MLVTSCLMLSDILTPEPVRGRTGRRGERPCFILHPVGAGSEPVPGTRVAHEANAPESSVPQGPSAPWQGTPRLAEAVSGKEALVPHNLHEQAKARC